MDAKYWNDQGRAVTKQIEARAKRYADGSWRGVLVVPTQRGVVAVCVELDKRDASRVAAASQEAHSEMSRGARQLARALHVADTVNGPDIIGDVVTITRPAATWLHREVKPVTTSNARPFTYGVVDVVGDLQSTLRSALGNVSNPLGAAQGTLGAALGGLASGGLEGAAQGALGAIGGALGLDPSQARAIAQRLAGGGGTIPQSVQEWQQRRDRALSELAAVVAAGTHPLGSDNWRGALNYHLTNGGITVPEHAALMRDQGVLATLPLVSPMLTDAALIAALQADGKLPVPWPPVPRTGAGALASMQAIMQSGSLFGAPVQTIQSARLDPTPGAAATAIASTRPADVAATLGAEELLRRARAQAIPQAADVVARALRAVDATAGANLGDARARDVVRRAIASEARNVRSALSIAQTLLGLR